MTDKQAPRSSTLKRPAPRGTAFYPRQRANKACQVCRARKTKCDNKKPTCSYCESVGATCIQSEQDLSSFDPASLKILERLESIERFLHENKNEPCSAHTTQEAEKRPTQHGDVSLESVLPENVEQVLQWPCFSVGRDVLPVVLSPSSVISGSATSHAPGMSSLDDIDGARLNVLLDNFFTYAHCKNPILDEQTTRKLVRRVCLDDGIDWSPASCLSLVILAVGCISGPFGPSHNVSPGSVLYNDSKFLFSAAQRRMGTLLSTLDIVGAQCFFLSGVYNMSVFQPLIAWRFFSQALAACQHFSFLTRAQQESYHNAHLTPQDPDNRKSDVYEQAVYWSAWKSEQELRSYLALPDFGTPDSGSSLYPPFFPTPPDPEPCQSPGSILEPHERRARSSWLFYLAEISLRRLHSRLRSEILTLRHTYTSTIRFLEALHDMIPEYETQAHDWANSLPGIFSIMGTDAAEDDVCRSVLRCHLINLFELIYWAGTMAGINIYTELPQGLMGSVDRVSQRGLEAHVNRLLCNEPGFSHRHHGTLFMVKNCTRSMLVLLAARGKGREMPQNWLQAIYKGLGMLEVWAPEIPELTAWTLTLQQELAKYLEQ